MFASIILSLNFVINWNKIQGPRDYCTVTMIKARPRKHKVVFFSFLSFSTKFRRYFFSVYYIFFYPTRFYDKSSDDHLVQNIPNLDDGLAVTSWQNIRVTAPNLRCIVHCHVLSDGNMP